MSKCIWNLVYRKSYAHGQVYTVKPRKLMRINKLRAGALTRGALARMRLKAIRRGVWFKRLGRDERKFIDLVIRVTNRVRSFLLAKLLFRIVEKLLDALEGEVTRLMRTVGRPLAEKLSGVARGWGNRSASKWPQDSGFVQYLTIMHLNKP